MGWHMRACSYLPVGCPRNVVNSNNFSGKVIALIITVCTSLTLLYCVLLNVGGELLGATKAKNSQLLITPKLFGFAS